MSGRGVPQNQEKAFKWLKKRQRLDKKSWCP